MVNLYTVKSVELYTFNVKGNHKSMFFQISEWLIKSHVEIVVDVPATLIFRKAVKRTVDVLIVNVGC